MRMGWLMLLLVLAAPASARVIRNADLTVAAGEDDRWRAAYALVEELEEAAIPREPTLVLLELTAEVEPGDEVELWVAVPEGLPWQVVDAAPLAKWTVDATNGKKVRFDVTCLVLRQRARELALPDLAIRLMREESPADLALTEGESPAIICHAR